MIHLSEKTWLLPDTGITLPYLPANILMYLCAQNETITYDLTTLTTPLTYDYDPTCCTFSSTTGATNCTYYAYDPGNSSINTGKSSSPYNYDNICGLHPCESRSTDKATYADSKVYYYGYRYYSPELGRWVSRDPLGERAFFQHYTSNMKWSEKSALKQQTLLPLYVFLQNGPLSSTDALGLIIAVGHREARIYFFIGHNLPGDDGYGWVKDQVEAWSEILNARCDRIVPYSCFNANLSDEVGDFKVPGFPEINETLGNENNEAVWNQGKDAIEAEARKLCRPPCCVSKVYVFFECQPDKDDPDKVHTVVDAHINDLLGEGVIGRNVCGETQIFDCSHGDSEQWSWSWYEPGN